MDLSELTHAVFEPLLHARFAVQLDETQSQELELIELESYGARPGFARQPFSLIFRGPRDPWFRQGTYAIEHAQLGAQHIFLVPIGPDALGMQYQAIFN